jgi:hypothetical protein
VLTPSVVSLNLVSSHRNVDAPPVEDRELRCTACGSRMFSSRAPELLLAGLKCSRCLGALELMPAT